MGFTEITVIVGGALDEERTFTDAETDEMDTYLARIQCEEFGDELAEVYRLYHDHEPFEDGEDPCIQYVQDHAPWWTSEAQK